MKWASSALGAKATAWVTKRLGQKTPKKERHLKKQKSYNLRRWGDFKKKTTGRKVWAPFQKDVSQNSG